MTGKNMNIGPRPADAPPDVKYNVIMPPAATSKVTGIRRARGLVGNDFGTTGGASTVMAPSGTGGAGSLGSREKFIV
jgi:hypothetical protein